MLCRPLIRPWTVPAIPFSSSKRCMPAWSTARHSSSSAWAGAILARQFLIDQGIEDAQAGILQALAQRLQAHPVGQRDVAFQRLPRQGAVCITVRVWPSIRPFLERYQPETENRDRGLEVTGRRRPKTSDSSWRSDPVSARGISSMAGSWTALVSFGISIPLCWKQTLLRPL